MVEGREDLGFALKAPDAIRIATRLRLAAPRSNYRAGG
jgi:hypothetical protein